MKPLTDLYIYDAPDAVGLDIRQMAGYLAELLPPVTVNTRTDFFTHHLARFTPAQIEALTAEISRRLAEREVHEFDPDLGPVYDAALLPQVLLPLIPEGERGAGHLHVVMMTQCLAERQSQGDPVLRILQPGNPALISATCFVEAPELPREYVFRRAQLEAFGLEEHIEELEDEFAARTLTHADPRVTLVARGYALQAVFHHLFGAAGCDRPSCPLYQAQTHDELMQAHLAAESGLCEHHRLMLQRAMALDW